MRIVIDFNSPEAIYIQLRNQIVMAIAQNQLQNGDSLPSVRTMAQELGVNLHTVNKAYAMLRQEGYLTLERRRGAVVSVKVEEKHTEVSQINHHMEMIIAQAICKDISREEMIRIVDEMYQTFCDTES